MRRRAEGGPRPGVYSRLAHEAEARDARRPPSALTRWTGRLLILALLAAVLAAALGVNPW